MNYEYPLTILTPTYNRANYLSRLYESLKSQTFQDFQWLIIDDGSNDDTQSIINSFKSHSFFLDYKIKPNGGKHTAINYSHPFIKGKMVCIVDSDDWLLSEAIEKIIVNMDYYSKYNNVKVISFLKGKITNEIVCDNIPSEIVISNHIDFRINGHRMGDCCEVIDSDVLKEFLFPEYKDEKFLSEGYLWNSVGFIYDTVYIPEIIYICEYLEDGLTKTGRKLRITCPHGGMDNCNSFFNNNNERLVNKRTLFKEALLFIAYGKFAGYNSKDIISRCRFPRLIKRNYLFGLLLYYYWKNKYLND